MTHAREVEAALLATEDAPVGCIVDCCWEEWVSMKEREEYEAKEGRERREEVKKNKEKNSRTNQPSSLVSLTFHLHLSAYSILIIDEEISTYH